jgi:hypothetical protein
MVTIYKKDKEKGMINWLDAEMQERRGKKKKKKKKKKKENKNKKKM